MRHFPLPPAKRSQTLWLGLFCLMLLAVLAIASGTVAIPPWRIPALLAGNLSGEQDEIWQSVLLSLRLPRLLLALATGSALAIAGCALQAVFRNPLAEPGLIGASSG
ncbi:iron chelate uptake ABC transporter family permease subunit, partial [Chitinimonas sp.]|uniref:iron chelate uptake ABC transporter family permease subunit n=1 Tax=Chitinimonas sp. TaxID=1934313 RepID=UPI0035B425A6